jgi:2-polyprenyl-3-methyl-5-hydroxy-6-metoxy-1,4-benzoquinol methylase
VNQTESPFAKEYFTQRSVYSKFKSAPAAVHSMSRWYAAFASIIDRRAGPLLGRTVADFGCGYAGLIGALQRRGAACRGLDISSYVIDANRQIFPRVRFDIADFSRPFEMDGLVDVAVSLEVVEHLEQPEALLRAMAASVRPGGYVVISTPNRGMRVPFYRWDTDPTHINVRHTRAWVEAIQNLGLKPTHVATYLTVPYIWRFSRLLSFALPLGAVGPTTFIVARKQAGEP